MFLLRNNKEIDSLRANDISPRALNRGSSIQFGKAIPLEPRDASKFLKHRKINKPHKMEKPFTPYREMFCKAQNKIVRVSGPPDKLIFRNRQVLLHSSPIFN